MEFIDAISNENIYLFSSNPEIISKLTEELKANIINREENREKYKEALELYLSFIKNYVAKFVKDSGVTNNSISYAYLLSIIMALGFCSKDLTLDNNKNEFIDLDGLQGLSIINGSARCRHYDVFFSDVFKELNMDGYVISVFKKENINLEKAFISLSNHALNVIEFNGISYPFDPTNYDIYKFIDKFTMQSYTNASTNAYFKPGMTADFNNEPFEDILNKLNKFDESSKKRPLTKVEIDEIYVETRALLQKNYFILSELKKDTVTTLKKNIISSFYNV